MTSTMGAIQSWLDARKIAYTAADLIAAASLGS